MGPSAKAKYLLDSSTICFAKNVSNSHGSDWVPPGYMLPGGTSYIPAERGVLVIAAGAPWVWDGPPQDGEGEALVSWAPKALEEAGYDVSVVWNGAYDRYPTGWREGRPDLKSRGGQNHITLADDFVVPKLRELVADGRGPAVIIAGSRGGQCTLPRLWDLGWRGGAVCVNAGCVLLGKVPSHCPLSLVTGGFDFFPQSADPKVLRRQTGWVGPKRPILVYHDPKMGHTGSPDDFKLHGHHMLSISVLERIIELTSCSHSSLPPDALADVPWPTGYSLQFI